MAPFIIDDEACHTLKDKVVVITGASSGIGFATAQHLASFGAKIVQGDLRPPQEATEPNIVYKKTDVTVWTELRDLFKEAKDRHGWISLPYSSPCRILDRNWVPALFINGRIQGMPFRFHIFQGLSKTVSYRLPFYSGLITIN